MLLYRAQPLERRLSRPILSPRTFLHPALDCSFLHPSPPFSVVWWFGRANFGLCASAPPLMRLCSFRQTIKLIYVTWLYLLYLITCVGLCEVLDSVQCHYNTERQLVNDWLCLEHVYLTYQFLVRPCTVHTLLFPPIPTRGPHQGAGPISVSAPLLLPWCGSAPSGKQ